MKRLVSSLVVATVLATHLPAPACGALPSEPSRLLAAAEPSGSRLAEVEAYLDGGGDPGEALRVLRVGGYLLTKSARQGGKAARLAALALSRGEGSWGGPWGEGQAKERWIVATLREAVERAPDDTNAAADLAEALSRTADRDEALAMLTDLADRGVLGSAHAWRELARLRLWAGDSGGSDDALIACRRVAADDDICVTPSALPPGLAAPALPRARLTPGS